MHHEIHTKVNTKLTIGMATVQDGTGVRSASWHPLPVTAYPPHKGGFFFPIFVSRLSI